MNLSVRARILAVTTRKERMPPKTPKMPMSSGNMGGKHPMTDAQMTKMMGGGKKK